MKYELNIKDKTKSDLVKEINSLNARYCGLKGLLYDYKATILLLQSQLNLQRKKLECWEKGHAKRTYTYLGSRHNRDIGTMKRAHLNRNERNKTKGLG